VARDLAVRVADQLDDPLEVAPLAHVLGRERPPLDELQHQRARLGVEHRRRDPRRVRRAARRQLVPPQDVVHGDVVADPDEAAPLPVVDYEVGVSDPAAHRLRGHGPAPDREGGRLGPRVQRDALRHFINTFDHPRPWRASSIALA
jgi:hypothetical protein